jgi:sucrose-6-phosphate hydrolase SacC (GH32 family)
MDVTIADDATAMQYYNEGVNSLTKAQDAYAQRQWSTTLSSARAAFDKLSVWKAYMQSYGKTTPKTDLDLECAVNLIKQLKKEWEDAMQRPKTAAEDVVMQDMDLAFEQLSM